MEYLVDVDIDIPAKEYRCKVILNYYSETSGLEEFLIHRNVQVNEIMLNGNSVEWIIEDTEIAFIPEAKKLILILETEILSKVSKTIKFDFKGCIDIFTNDINQINDKYIELNIYSPWYPILSDLKREANATVSISGLEDLYVLKASKNDKKWNLNLKGVDIYIIAFCKPIIKEKQLKAGLVRLISSEESDSTQVRKMILNSIEEILNFYIEIFSNTYDIQRELDIVIAPRIKGSGYCREDLIVMTEVELTKQEYGRFLAHELSHLWFKGAEVLSWEDWLNESFAEYGALLYIEDKYGREPYEEAINKLREYTKYCPPIKDSDRNSKEGSKIRYKGTVVLHEMRELFGLRTIKKVFNILNQLDVKTTDNLIEKLVTINEKLSCFLEEKIT